MELIFIYIIFYIALIVFTKRKSEKVVFMSTLVMYLFSSLAALYIYGIMYKGAPIVLEAVVFHIVMLFLLLYPLQQFDKIKYLDIAKSNDRKLKLFSSIIIFLCLFKMFFDIQNVNMNLLLTDVGDLRNALSEGEFRESNALIRYLHFFASQYWSVALALAFYYMRYYPRKRVIIFLLLLSSLGVIVSGITVAAREYFIKYVFLFSILFYWFSSTISTDWKYKIRILLLILGVVFASFFLLITFLRFGDTSSYAYSPLDSLLSYLGQGYIHFSSYFMEFPDGATGGAMKFPFFVGRSISAFNLSDTIYSKAVLNAFSTTIGSWILDVGIYWTIIITLIHFFLFNRIGRKKYTVFKLIYIVWIYDFIFSTMFFYNEILNGTRILSILFIILFERLSLTGAKKTQYNWL